MAHTEGSGRPPSAAHALTPGATLAGRFEIIRTIGAGGMGRVYEAQDRLLGVRVALKVMHSQGSSELRAARFRRELQLARQISHPNVCRLHDVIVDRSSDEPRIFLSMELIRGETLAERLRRGRLTTAEALPLARQLAAALEASHRAGVVHRDLKPSNVLLEPAPESPGGVRVVVTDFGIARTVEDEPDTPSLTGTGEVLGTPAYMAPEQAEAGEVTPATDVYSLGLVLYEMVTGRLPFSGDGLAMIVQRVKEAPPPPRTHTPDLDPRWDATIVRCLERDPAARFRRASDVPLALEGRLRARRWRPAQVASLVAMALTLGAVGVYLGRSARLGRGRVEVEASERLTFDLGCEEFPAYSPDGRTLYYDAVFAGDAELVARDLKSGEVRRLTHSPGEDYGAAASPDGAWVAYLNLGKDRELRVMPATGGEPLTLGRAYGTPAWGPDGRVVSSEYDGSLHAWRRGAEGWQRLAAGAVSGGTPVRRLVFARDRLFGLLLRVADGQIQLAELSASGAEIVEENVNQGQTQIAATADALYYGRRSVGGGQALVRRALTGGDVQPVPGGLPARSGFAVSPDGRELIYSTCGAQYYLARVAADGSWRELTPRGEFRFEDLEVLDSKRLLVSTDRSGEPRAWSLDPATLDMRPVTPPGSTNGAVSGDGRWIAYVDGREGGVVVVPTAGGEPRRLTKDRTDTEPHVTFDGRHVIFRRGAKGGERVHVVPFEGGEPRLISPPNTFAALPSPTEDHIVMLVMTSDGQDVMATNVAGGLPAPLSPDLPRGDYVGLVFAPDGQHVLLARNAGKEIVEVPAHGGPPKLRLRSPVDATESVTYAPDGDGLIVSMRTWDGDLWRATGRFP